MNFACWFRDFECYDKQKYDQLKLKYQLMKRFDGFWVQNSPQLTVVITFLVILTFVLETTKQRLDFVYLGFEWAM